MITQEEFRDGVLKYIDAEIFPRLPTSSRWLAGTYLAIISSKTNFIINYFLNNNFLNKLELINERGFIDEETLLNGIKVAAVKYGPLELNIPLIGILKFDVSDVETLSRYLGGSKWTT